MGNESSNDRSCDVGCQHNANEDHQYVHYPGDSFETTHWKNEVNEALKRAESSEPAGSDGLSSVVQSVIDGYTLTHADENIARGCGKGKKDDKNDKDDKE